MDGLFFQLSELQNDAEHLKSDLSEARSQYKDCAQEVNTSYVTPKIHKKLYKFYMDCIWHIAVDCWTTIAYLSNEIESQQLRSG